ncbi:hypothetical protein PHLGIDRAFT_130465, partial [Phlebiopsis gigantea 11061_1 CR5-6]
SCASSSASTPRGARRTRRSCARSTGGTCAGWRRTSQRCCPWSTSARPGPRRCGRAGRGGQRRRWRLKSSRCTQQAARPETPRARCTTRTKTAPRWNL